MFLSLAVKNHSNKIIWAFSLITLMGFVATLYILSRKVNPDEGQVKQINTKNEQVLVYIATYILPFLGFNLDDMYEQISLLIVFVTMGVLYIKSDLMYINPLFLLLGYNIYEVILENDKKRIFISKRNYIDIKNKKLIEFYELEDRQIILEQ